MHVHVNVGVKQIESYSKHIIVKWTHVNARCELYFGKRVPHIPDVAMLGPSGRHMKIQIYVYLITIKTSLGGMVQFSIQFSLSPSLSLYIYIYIYIYIYNIYM